MLPSVANAQTPGILEKKQAFKLSYCLTLILSTFHCFLRCEGEDCVTIRPVSRQCFVAKANTYLGYKLKKVEIGAEDGHVIVNGNIKETYNGTSSLEKFQKAKKKAIAFSWSAEM